MLTKAIQSYIEKDREHLHTAIPAKVIRYVRDKQKADVQPLIQERYLDGKLIDYPIIYDVPVIFPGAGGGQITFPLRVDDVVLLIFSERSIDRWVHSTSKAPIDPQDTRKHDLSDAIAIPGLFSFNTAPGSDGSDVVITFSGSTVKLKSSGNIEINPSGDVIVNGDATVNGNVNVTGAYDVVAGTISLRTHTHTHGGDAGTTSVPSP